MLINKIYFDDSEAFSEQPIDKDDIYKNIKKYNANKT